MNETENILMDVTKAMLKVLKKYNVASVQYPEIVAIILISELAWAQLSKKRVKDLLKLIENSYVTEQMLKKYHLPRELDK